MLNEIINSLAVVFPNFAKKMNTYSRLIIPYPKFQNEIEILLNEAELIKDFAANSEVDFTVLESKIKEWNSKAQTVLKISFEAPENGFYFEFSSMPGQFIIPALGNVRVKSLYERVNATKGILKTKMDYLRHNLRIIQECDFIKSASGVDFELRKKYSIRQKLNFILEKLYNLNDGSSYPLEMLLDGNGITIKNAEETRELAKILENQGYISSFGGLGQELHVSISATGQMAVEESLQKFEEDYEEISSDKALINQEIELLKEHLTQMGYGQAKILDELEELKGLYGKLTKKNWGQIIKGKLIDLALGKLVEPDTLNLIYHSLTGHDFHLLH